MKNTKIMLLALLLITSLVFSACQANPATEIAQTDDTSAAEPVVEEKVKEVAPTEEPTEESAAVTEKTPATVNEDTDKKALLVISFGTSYKDTREKTIVVSENALAEAFPDYDLKRAFTSNIIIKVLKDRDGIEVNNVTEAIEEIYAEGYGEVLVQPLHVINGAEYHDLKNELAPYADKFAKFSLGSPLLTHSADYVSMVEAVAAQLPALGEKEAVVFMGHGTHHHANAAYGALDYTLKLNGYPNVYVGTVEGSPTLDDVMQHLDADGIEKVTLMPLMVVAGDHAQNDMAGDEDDSWKVILKAAGYEVDTLLVGLGEMEGIHQMYIEHAQTALEGEDEEETVVSENLPTAVNEDTDKKALLVISFGTSYKDTREKTIVVSENALAEAFPDYDLKRAFTSNIIIKVLKDRDGIEVNNVTEAIEEIYAEGYGEVLVQPLHVINGAEYHDLKNELAPYADKFAKFSLGSPLLTHSADYVSMVEAVAAQLPALGEKEAVVFMGHGTHHHANAAYGALDYTLKLNGYPNVYVGTVEGSPTLDDVMQHLDADGIEKVTLMPLMVVAGDHAQNDMAGDEDDSWKVILKAAGYEVDTLLVGLGEMEGIHQMYIEHAQTALEGEHEG